MTEKQIAKEVNRLSQLLKDLRVDEAYLDDAVHTCAQAYWDPQLNEAENEDEQDDIISRAEEDASIINNDGVESQLDYLIRHNSIEWVEGLIRKSTKT